MKAAESCFVKQKERVTTDGLKIIVRVNKKMHLNAYFWVSIGR